MAIQWHLDIDLIGDIQAIWTEYSGEGVVVAVYDDGIDRSHVDLDDNYDASLELDHPSTLAEPNNADMGHGTAVAGIIAAENNGVGTIGIAWGATLVSNDFFEGSNSASLPLSELNAMANFDIVNNSWGSFGYVFNFNQIFSNNTFSTVWQSLENTAANGRGGLGTIVIKSAGNNADTYAPSAQFDDVNVSIHTIAVGASDSDGDIFSYSSWGVNVLISAPAASVTTDLSAPGWGYNDGSSAWMLGDDDYSAQFGGTSASAPVVSGVVALMLDANENLGWRDVQQILAISASHTGSDIGGSSTYFEAAEWMEVGGLSWNGGDITFHMNYGYGQVDVFGAVRMAEVWLEIYGDAKTSANQNNFDAINGAPFIATSGSFNDAFGDNIGAVADISLTVSAQDAVSIEHIYVNVDVTHSWIGDLTITLTAPDGTDFILNQGYDENGATNANYLDDIDGYTFAVVAALGMSSEGEWTLTVEDIGGAVNSGVLDSFDLWFYGTELTTDTVHHFTDDFLYYTAYDGSRATITDGDGEIDWINIAASQIDLEVNLSDDGAMLARDPYNNGSGMVGVAVLDDGHTLENIASGDGNDTLNGNALNNVIIAGRGDDSVSGMEGDDTLKGHQGNDNLSGGDGFDALHGGNGEDTLSGGEQADNLYGDAGRETLSGGGGADRLNGGDENDSIDGDGGDDVMWGGFGDDTMNGGDNTDRIAGQHGSDLMYGDDGNDTINGGSGFDTIYGGEGDDSIIGGNNADNLNGDLGNDTLNGGQGDDRLYGGDNDDLMHGSFGDDLMGGDAGNDTLNGNGGNDRLFGLDGDDELNGGSGFDRLIGGRDNDVLNGGDNADNLFGDNGNDTLDGGNGADRLFGGNNDDDMSGGDGNDVFWAGFGNDIARGGDHDDRIFGQAGNDTLKGDEGNDTLTGGSGFDQLNGGLGDDEMTGGTNADQFIFNDNFGADTITDFQALNTSEKINLSGLTTNYTIDDILGTGGPSLASQIGGTNDVLIDFGSGNTITLENVTLGDLDASDFIF